MVQLQYFRADMQVRPHNSIGALFCLYSSIEYFFNSPRILGQVLCIFLLLMLVGIQGVSAQTTCSSTDIDQDDDGLIEICDLEGLNAMRNNRSGSGTMEQGCPTDGCTGYELTRSLDFNNDASYRTIANKTTWTTGDGFEPIGVFGGGRGFSATFNGNGYTISNLYINRNGTDGIQACLVLREVKLPIWVCSMWILAGRSSVGGLAGRNSNTITNSYVTGTVEGSGSVGGLVGTNAVALSPTAVRPRLFQALVIR